LLDPMQQQAVQLRLQHH